MNREIKFRVYDTFLKQMTGPKGLSVSVRNGKIDYVSYSFEKGTTSCKWTSASPDGLDTDRYKLMQFTGLIDKHGTEIYEGDILPFRFNTGSGIVMWDRATCSYDIYNAVENWTYSEHLIDVSGEGDLGYNPWEVLGNIHQHPHYLLPYVGIL